MTIAPPSEDSEPGFLRSLARPFAAAFVFGIILHGLVVAWLPTFPDRDAWYHIRHAQLLLAGDAAWNGLTFPWMAHSAYADFPTDWSLGWHWLIAPFTLIGNLVWAMKIAVVVQAAFLTGVFHALVQRARVPWPWAWTALLAVGCAAWLFRTHMGRPTPLVVGILLLLFAAVVERRIAWTAGLSFLVVLIYHVPAPALLVGACGVAAVLVVDRKLPWRLALAGAGGIGLAIVVHPGFWSIGDGGFFSLDHATFHLWTLMRESLAFAASGGVVEYEDGGQLGGLLPLELAAPSTATLLREFTVPLLATVWGGVCALSRRRDHWITGTAVFAVIGLVSASNSGRFIEYWYPFALLCGALAFRVPKNADEARADELSGADLSAAPTPGVGRKVLFAVLVIGALGQISLLRSWMRDEGDAGGALVAPGVHAIVARAKPGDIVWHGKWDEFAPLFHFGPSVRWISGFDPWYSIARDPEDVRAQLFCTLPDAYDDATLRTVLRERFGARFVLLWRGATDVDPYAALRQRLRHLPWAEEVFADSQTTAFELR